MSKTAPRTDVTSEHASSASTATIDRRALLVGGGVALAALAGYPLIRRKFRSRAAVFVARHQRYDGPLATTIREGLLSTGLDPAAVSGRRVLLKPNLVEPYRRSPQMTTHPAMVAAATAVFRDWGADVSVGEGPGHVRDTEMAIVESNLRETLIAEGLPFADLNYESVAWRPNAGRASRLDGFYFPQSVLEADLIVSMPKLKTHHWVGFTASMKNLYGVIPGIKYGWPKNVLHYAGIPETVFDISACLPNTLAIVDGILCMEGDGPILGTAKPMGLVAVGTNPAAVDATLARIMGLVPERIGYLKLANQRLGPTDDDCIEQRGERWQDLVSPFQVLDEPHLRTLRADSGPLLSRCRADVSPLA